MIVFDASTLILLAKADLLEPFLRASKMEAVIPREVEREACEAKQSVDALQIRRLVADGTLVVETLRNRALIEKLRGDLGLGLGEAAAIALGLIRKAELVATDDKRGIDACKLLKLSFTSAPAILVRMSERGIVDRQTALLRLSILEREGRYKRSIIAATRSRLEVI
jgi:predicted nucleic acid-binding protein